MDHENVEHTYNKKNYSPIKKKIKCKTHKYMDGARHNISE